MINLIMRDGSIVTVTEESGWACDAYPGMANALNTLYPVTGESIAERAAVVSKRFEWTIEAPSAPASTESAPAP